MVFFFWKKECWCLQTNVLGVGLLCDEGVGIRDGVIVVAAWGVCGGPRWPVVPGDTWLNCSDFFFFFTRTVITARLGNAPERWVVSAQRNRRQQWARPKKHVNWFSGTVALIYLLPDQKFCNEIRYLPASLCFELLGLRTNTLLFLPKWTPTVTSNASMNALCNLLYCHGYRLFWTHEPKI